MASPHAPVKDDGQVHGCQGNQKREIDFIDNFSTLESGSDEQQEKQDNDYQERIVSHLEGYRGEMGPSYVHWVSLTCF